MTYHVYFSEAKIELGREIKRHPKLLDEIALEGLGAGGLDFSEELGTIAAYCEVILNGEYTDPEIERLYEILLVKLRKKREIILL